MNFEKLEFSTIVNGCTSGHFLKSKMKLWSGSHVGLSAPGRVLCPDGTGPSKARGTDRAACRHHGSCWRTNVASCALGRGIRFGCDFSGLPGWFLGVCQMTQVTLSFFQPVLALGHMWDLEGDDPVLQSYLLSSQTPDNINTTSALVKIIN